MTLFCESLGSVSYTNFLRLIRLKQTLSTVHGRLRHYFIVLPLSISIASTSISSNDNDL